MFKKKDIFTSLEKDNLTSKFFEDCEYFGNLVVRQWIERGDALAANQLLTSGINSLINMVFLANEEYPPHQKWALNYSYSLKWLPRNWKERISKLILTKEISFTEAKRRLRTFVRLYKDCWEKVFGRKSRNLGYITITTMKELQYIIDNSPVSIEKFAERFDIKHLSYEPIFKFTEIITKDNKRLITFNKEKYVKLKAKNFPNVLDWSRPALNNLNID